MTALMIFVDADRARDVEQILEARDLPGYTEFPTVLGKGQTGRKLGTRAFPGSTSLYFTVLPRNNAPALIDALRELRARRGAAEGLKVYAFNTEELL
ncbi:MAG: hypothetical protein Q8Q14_04155 [Gemmatimonadales bacterium]|nr:hypothetical protein [Gemmatimonadales bacterium]